jgi:hypothetical protein
LVICWSSRLSSSERQVRHVGEHALQRRWPQPSRRSASAAGDAHVGLEQRGPPVRGINENAHAAGATCASRTGYGNPEREVRTTAAKLSNCAIMHSTLSRGMWSAGMAAVGPVRVCSMTGS